MLRRAAAAAAARGVRRPLGLRQRGGAGRWGWERGRERNGPGERGQGLGRGAGAGAGSGSGGRGPGPGIGTGIGPGPGSCPPPPDDPRLPQPRRRCPRPEDLHADGGRRWARGGRGAGPARPCPVLSPPRACRRLLQHLHRGEEAQGRPRLRGAGLHGRAELRHRVSAPRGLPRPPPPRAPGGRSPPLTPFPRRRLASEFGVEKGHAFVEQLRKVSAAGRPSSPRGPAACRAGFRQDAPVDT